MNASVFARQTMNSLILLLILATASACGSSDGTTATASPSTGADTSSGGGQDTAVVAAANVTSEVIHVQATALSITSEALGVVLKPDSCTASHKCPLVVVVGDSATPLYPKYTNGASQLAGALGVGMVIFNLPGTGEAQYIAGQKSDNDIGGPLHQAAVKNVLNLKSKADWVDPAKLGFVTIGNGLSPTVKAIKTYDALKSILFLIDVEGPIDRCAYSQAPADPDLQIGPDDGPGATPSTCHITDSSPHSAMYPAAHDGLPASIVCSEGAWPISKTAKNCADNAWWIEREAYGYLKDATYRYQRLQFQYDHSQPSYWSSRKAMEAVISSKSPYFQLNDMPACGAPFSDADCKGLPCWLSGGYGNGMAPAPYAGKNLIQVTPDGLFTQVLGGYLVRMLDTVSYPKCHG